LMVKVMGKCGECGKCGEFFSLFRIFRDNNLLFYRRYAYGSYANAPGCGVWGVGYRGFFYTLHPTPYTLVQTELKCLLAPLLKTYPCEETPLRVLFEKASPTAVCLCQGTCPPQLLHRNGLASQDRACSLNQQRHK
jgi:hypothetical protein